MKKIYCFDFDGTLTYKDTMFLFLKFYNRRRYWVQFIRHIPLFILLKINLLEAENVKRSFISSILKGEKKEKIETKAEAFFKTNFPRVFRPNALDFIQKIDRENTESYIVSASLDIWLKPFAKHFGMRLLCTETCFENEVFTGKFATPNCNGEEKVRRIKKALEGEKYDKIIAFGDTFGDKPMLNFANEGYYKFFH